MLRTDSAFKGFCEAKWSARSIYDLILNLRFTKSELSLLPVHEKLQTIYQCSLACEYGDTSEARVASHIWSLGVPALHAKKLAISDSCKQLIFYLKSLCNKNCFYSLPTDVFETLVTNIAADPDVLP